MLTPSSSTSDTWVRFTALPEVEKLVVPCGWLEVNSTEA